MGCNARKTKQQTTTTTTTANNNNNNNNNNNYNYYYYYCIYFRNMVFGLTKGVLVERPKIKQML